MFARAQALIEAFGSVGAVMSANTDMLADVEGIGVGAATSIARAIGDEPAQSVDTLSMTPDREWPHRRPKALTD
jgi:ERCC4-type nuclease